MNRPRPFVSALFGSTIFLSAFLLFSIQPMFAKLLLPWFGGSATVWTTCLVFYQTALLAGYGYAWLAAKRLRATPQAALHSILLMAAIGVLWGQERGERLGIAANLSGHLVDHPTAQILLLLFAMIGLPYLLLSATSPLLQNWYGGERTYRLFALSNAGSLIALIAYPILIEPRLSWPVQERVWSTIFVGFALLCAVAAWVGTKKAAESASPPIEEHASPIRRFEWIALSAAGSMLLLATTNQLTQNIAPVPMLWVLPLAVYLITFILAFDSPRWYRREPSLRLLAIALASVAYAISDIQLSDALIVSIPLFIGALFLGCLFCHGELNRLKPAPSQLTSFYLMIALGGALGAILIGLIAPLISSGIYELPIVMTMVAALALWMNWTSGMARRLLWSAVTVAMVVLSVSQVRAYHRNAVDLERNFYGSLRVTESNNLRMLYHGTIEHGSQFLAPDLRRTPTTYYGYSSGVGIALRNSGDRPRRLGVIGLGTGTLAAYGKAGDELRFYEINPQVVEIARKRFSYLSDSAARIEITLGDARLSLQKERSSERADSATLGFDVLMVDAFSGDAIPVHLLTQEAFALYLSQLKAGGILAIHVSNQYLNLTPVVGQLAAVNGLGAVEIRSPKDESRQISEAVWILMSQNRDFFTRPEIVTPGGGSRVLPLRGETGRRVWTDDYNNLFEVMRWIPN